MPRKADNHIRVTDDTWSDLNQLKRPGESFDDVLQRLLEEDEEEDEGGNRTMLATAD